MKTVSLELAKTLKEKGYPQLASCWYILYGSEENVRETYELELDAFKPSEAPEGDPDIAAPTADEILDKLPAMVIFEDEKYYFIIEKFPHSNHFELKYITEEEYSTILDNGDCMRSDRVLANAAAKIWLYLKEKNLLGVK